MKKLIIILLAIFCVVESFSQKNFVRRVDQYLAVQNIEKAKENLDSAMKYQANRSWALTHVVAGKFYTEVIKANRQDLIPDTDPYLAAAESYMLAAAYDSLKKYKNQIALGILSLKPQLNERGAASFNNREFKKSYDYFHASVRLGELSLSDKTVDTILMYNAALAAFNNKDYDNSLAYYSKVYGMGYMEEVPAITMHSIYIAKGDSVAAENILKDAISRYPAKNYVLIELINYYLFTGKAQEALNYIAIAKEKEPTNASLDFAEGNMYEKINNIAKAKESYRSSIGKDSSYAKSYFNLGVIEYNAAMELYAEANNIPLKEVAKYEQKIKEAQNKLSEALPYFEKVRQLEPNDIANLNSLKETYFKLKMINEYNEVKKVLDNLVK